MRSIDLDQTHCIPKMDASLQGRRPNTLFSQASRSQNDMRSINLDSSPLNQEGCSHFSIRGYVADVRRFNRKICWPFDECHDHFTLKKNENMLPPISAAKFIWWDCENCLASHSIWSQQKLLLQSSVGVHGLFKSHPFKEGKNQIQVKPVTNKLSCYEKFKHPCNQTYGCQKSIKGNMFVINSMQSNEGKCFASRESKLNTQKKKNIQKRRQKIRMLNDIMENEILETARNIPSCDKHDCSANIPPKNDFCSNTNVFKVLKDNDESSKENIKMMKNKKKRRVSEIEEVEGFPLIQLTNRTSEKAKFVELADSESKLAEHVLPAKSTESNLPKILMDITKKGVVITQGKKQDGIFKDEFCTDGKNMVADKNDAQKPNDHIITLTKSARSVLGKRVMNSELTTFHDRPHKKGKTSKKQCRDAKCYARQGSKTFFRTSENEKVQIACSKSFQNISEKSTEKLNHASDSAVVDGIPVGILKLLQENWIKRQLVNGGECSKQSIIASGSSEKTTKSVEDGSTLIWTNNNCDEIQNIQTKQCVVTQEKIPTIQSEWHSYSSALGDDAGLPGKAIEYSCHDLNFGDIRTLPLIDSIDGYSSNHKEAILNVDSSKDGLVWGLNSCQAYTLSHQSSIMSSGMRKSSEILYQRHLTSRPMDMVLEKGEFKGCSSAIPFKRRSNGKFYPSNYSISMFNQYNARTMLPPPPPPPQLDINKNDTVSAMHLLKLMDPAVSSNAPTCSSMDRGPNSFPMNRDFSHVCNSQRKHQMLMHNQHNFHQNHDNPGMITSDFCLLQHPNSGSFHEPTFSEENYRQSSTWVNYGNPESMNSQKKNKKSVEVFRLENEDYEISMISHRKKKKSVEVSRTVMDNGGIGLCCVLNRNPADFIIPDESNEYMIGGHDEFRMPHNYQHPPEQKQNKIVMKVTALKDLL